MNLRRKLNSQSTVDSDGTWAISYGDMITLLLSFFVLYFSTDFDKQVEEKLGHSVETEIQKINAELESSNDLLHEMELKDLPLADGEDFKEKVDLKLYKAGKSFMIQFSGVSFFNSGHVKIRDKAEKVLKVLIPRIEPFLGKYKVKIRAFTDSEPVSIGSRYRDNIELSVIRALSVKRLMEENGVPRRRIEVTGNGPMGEKLLDFLGVDKQNFDLRQSLSRSVIILLKRDDYGQS